MSSRFFHFMLLPLPLIQSKPSFSLLPLTSVKHLRTPVYTCCLPSAPLIHSTIHSNLVSCSIILWKQRLLFCAFMPLHLMKFKKVLILLRSMLYCRPLSSRGFCGLHISISFLLCGSFSDIYTWMYKFYIQIFPLSSWFPLCNLDCLKMQNLQNHSSELN